MQKKAERSSLDSTWRLFNNLGAVCSIKSQQRICGPFQHKALRNFTLTHSQAGPNDKKHNSIYVAFEHVQQTWCI